MITQETDRQIVKEFIVIPEHLSEWRLAVGTLREKPGIEERTLYMAKLLHEAARDLDEHEHAFHFLLEQSLVWQHIVMNERDKSKGRKEERMTFALNEMESRAAQAEDYRQAYDLDDLEGDSLRFLGKVAEYKGEYIEALSFYQESKKLLLEKPESDGGRIRWIEVQGFEAVSLIMNGDAQSGLNLAKETWELYKNMEFDLYTHKVWQSGVAIGAVRALLAVGEIELLGKDGAKNWFDQAESLLVIPEGDETWGDKNFQIRKDEIAAIRRKLKA